MKAAIVVIVLLLAALVAGPALAARPHSPPVVYLQSESLLIPKLDLDRALPAFQTSVTRDLAPAWGTDAILTTDPARAKSADMVISVEDVATCFGCLGYHEVYGGRPYAYVFADVCETAHDSWQLVLTHELQEMLVDPWINRGAWFNGRWWLTEVSDPVEDGYYAYKIDGVVISDFILPSWYGGGLDGSLPLGAPYDFTRKLKRAGQIGRHGYASWWSPSRREWMQAIG